MTFELSMQYGVGKVFSRVTTLYIGVMNSQSEGFLILQNQNFSRFPIWNPNFFSHFEAILTSITNYIIRVIMVKSS